MHKDGEVLNVFKTYCIKFFACASAYTRFRVLQYSDFSHILQKSIIRMNKSCEYLKSGVKTDI